MENLDLFIQFTAKKDDSPVTINSSSIQYIEKTEDGTVIGVNSAKEILVKDRYEAVIGALPNFMVAVDLKPKDKD